MRLLLMVSIAINIWFQVKEDAVTWHINKICPMTKGASYTETYILRIPYDFICSGGEK